MVMVTLGPDPSRIIKLRNGTSNDFLSPICALDEDLVDVWSIQDAQISRYHRTYQGRRAIQMHT